MVCYSEKGLKQFGIAKLNPYQDQEDVWRDLDGRRQHKVCVCVPAQIDRVHAQSVVAHGCDEPVGEHDQGVGGHPPVVEQEAQTELLRLKIIISGVFFEDSFNKW